MRLLRPRGAVTNYSGGGEDAWILKQFEPDFKGYACELGAHDGSHKSNTRLLEEKGWTVLCIEPNPRHQKALRETRKLVMTCACAAEPQVRAPLYEATQIFMQTCASIQQKHPGTESEVTVLTLDQCLMVADFPRLDVLSLDVDGIESDILLGFDIKRWDPKVVVIEDREDVKHLMDKAGYRVAASMSDSNVMFLKT